MRESLKLQRTHFPPDTYEGWLRVQAVRPAGPKLGSRVTKDQYEVWLTKSVEKLVQTTGRPKPRKR